jgi:hypothetical protein
MNDSQSDLGSATGIELPYEKALNDGSAPDIFGMLFGNPRTFAALHHTMHREPPQHS